MDHCEELLLDYFRFVRGVVDSPDISLNILRETLQQTRQLKSISSNIEKKILSELEKKQKDYEKFLQAFGLQIKYSTVSDYDMNKDKLEDLMLSRSSAGNELTSLAQYVKCISSEQKTIYYAAGENLQ